MENFKAFMKRKNIEISLKRYGIDALGAMAQGLFCSLLIGTIINTLGTLFHIGFLTATVATIAGTDYTVGGLTMAMSGPAMAVAIGYALQCPPMVLFSLVAVGFASNALGGAGGPLAVLFVAIITAEVGKMVSGETKVDILVTPLVTVGVGVFFSWLLAPALGKLAMMVGTFIMWATDLQPFLMGILVSVVVGIALTLPISSAAICAALGLTGLAGGAAVAGCCAQMVGFAVMSFKENRWGGLVSQGIGTSMLQMPNIVRNPRVWIAPTVASAITGPIATCVFHLQMNGPAIDSGMGTCGLCGQIGVFQGWLADIEAGKMAAITGTDWLGLILISFVLPAVLAPLINMFCRKKGWVKDGDLTLGPVRAKEETSEEIQAQGAQPAEA
ncbi:MAG: PTS sugar transporter subunit IIC [Anaerovoracaceae bacterium]|nr:PTS sugar transporter subunit IIC [Bacillota bacterium]MDY2670973.1 PTS sugar transporter subunit IIC [Anaerovoracaceae bacterium]